MNSRFVNPYNFIKFPKMKAQKYDDSDRHTGVIEYTLTTKSPLFIPNSSNDNAFGSKIPDHKTYDFYSYTNLANQTVNNEYSKPVIPGSEMRGLIRSTYETLTDSCMGLLNDVHPIKRVGAMFKPGLLTFDENGILSLVSAKSLRINRSNCENRLDGSKVYFNMPKKERNASGAMIDGKISNFSFNKQTYERNIQQNIGGRLENVTEEASYSKTGYLIKWGFGVKKNNYHVFYDLDEDYVADELDPASIKRMMNDVVNSYKEQPAVEPRNMEAYNAYQEAFNNFIDTKGYDFPVNYAMVDDNLYISPTTYSKEVSKNSIGDLTIYKPCVKDFCPTCDLFGRVGDDPKGSPIRFSDLTAEHREHNKDYYYGNKVTLSNLNSPKLGNVDFYLEKPVLASYWSYDYLVKDGRLELANGVLRGRKYYWHFPNEVILKEGVEATNLNKTVRPVKKGVSFSGKLYFDGISEKQLKQLIYILNTSKENLGLKLGMGKPLGLGSVALKVDRVKTRNISLIDDEVAYVEEDYNFNDVNYESAKLSNTAKAEFEKIASFNGVPKNYEVCYPKTSAVDDNGFEWFIANHYEGGFISMIDKREKMYINEALPHILDADISMPCLDKARKRSGYNNNQNRNANNGNRNNHHGDRNKNNHFDKKRNWR